MTIGRFYTGAHMPCWLGRTDQPLFVSAVRLRGRRSYPRALGHWALDSGGFSELSLHGRWRTSAAQYAEEVLRWQEEIGGLDWAAVQDWMCEPSIRELTGLSVEAHQARTVQSYLDLRALAPSVPWAPVLQGWTLGEYDDHVALYASAGIDLRELPVVGVGSICRRQQHLRGVMILAEIASYGIRAHAFGLKRTGLEGLATLGVQLASADSMAWSYHARAEKNGRQNDLHYALRWSEDTLAALGLAAEAAPVQVQPLPAAGQLQLSFA